ncbi:MAG: GntR family transcriptional regulator [Beutenbergiaceae bacterium]
MADSTTPHLGIQIRREAPVALHVQISDSIRSRITSGQWPAHYRLKSEPELAADLSVSRGTLRRALTTLIDEGLLRQIQGRGTFVTSHVIEPSIAQELTTISEDLASQGVNARTEVLSARIIPAPLPIMNLLDIAASPQVLQLRRLRSTDSGPVALFLNYVRVDLTPGIGDVDFTRQSLFSVLEQQFGLQIGSGRRTFAAQPAIGEIAQWLQLPEQAPVQYLEQITYLQDGRPLEYSDVWIDSNKMRVTSLLKRRRAGAP